MVILNDSARIYRKEEIMYYNTAGNLIREIPDICDCGLTCGCEKCNSTTFYCNIMNRYPKISYLLKEVFEYLDIKNE
jgi:hypothetical protein